MTSSHGVSAQFLLEGAVYALEQAGLLLHDAHLLYQHQRYSSAIVMVLFAREEIGRYRIIREIRKEMLEADRVVTLEELVTRCSNHMTKQRLGNIASVMRVSQGEELWDLLIVRMNSHPQSAEFEKADRRLNYIQRKRNKELPDQRHKLRKTALYVDPSNSGDTWNRPKVKNQADAFKEIEDVCNDYALTLDRFIHGDLYRDDDPSFYDDLRAWTDCPVIPNRPVVTNWHPPV